MPVVGILLVTSEWSQRTAQVTFTLVPSAARAGGQDRRKRMLASQRSWSTIVALGAVHGDRQEVIDRDDAWRPRRRRLIQTALFDVISMLVGVALGAAILLSAPAIVAAFVLPIGISLVMELVPGLDSPANWIDQSKALSPLSDHDLRHEWGRVVTAALCGARCRWRSGCTGSCGATLARAR